MILKAIEVIKEVNLWAENETNGLIKDILPQRSVYYLTRLIFANAMYFKGVWNQTFHSSEIDDNNFHLLDGSSITVPFMTSSHDQFIEVFDDFKVLRLPYEQEEDERQFSMYVFLPNAKYGLPALVKKVASDLFELLKHNLPLVKREVNHLRIPRFKFSFDLETSHMLKELGVILPFSPGGLTKMVDSREGEDFCVSKIFHKSFIEVNEKGTEAATTSTAMVDYIVDESDDECDPIRIDFIVDHPFLFLIREVSTRTILFVG
ncbi:serpin-ZX, partial [Trifolium medium]|nr:serpin-ZX [Trifolium medium]